MPEPRYSEAVLLDLPIAYWRLGESVGPVAADRRVYPPPGVSPPNYLYDGVYMGDPELGAKGLLHSADADNMVVLNGLTQYVDVHADPLPINSPLNLRAPCTVEAWARLDAWPLTPGDEVSRIISKIYLGLGWGFGVTGPMAAAGRGALRFSVYGRKDYDSAPGLVQLGVPYHFAARLNADLTCDLFLNGALVTHVAAGPFGPNPADDNVAIGQSGPSEGSEWWAGAIDEVALFDKGLTDGAITKHYLAGATPGTPKAWHKLEIAWGIKIRGTFQLDLSQLDGPDTIAESSWSQTFSGAHDDVTADVEQIQWTRGRSDDLSEMQALEATITLRDPNGKYNPKDPTTPLAGQLLPMRPVRLTSFYDDRSWPRFYGMVRSIQHEPQGRTGVTTIEVSDLFLWLGAPSSRAGAPIAPGIQPVAVHPGAPVPMTPTDNAALGGAPGVIINPMGATSIGGVLGALLDAIGFTDSSMRLLDHGDELASFSPDGRTDGLQLVSDLMQAARGAVFVDKQGRFVFEDRNHRALRSVEWWLSRAVVAVAPGASQDGIINRWKVNRQFPSGGSLIDGPVQLAADGNSQNAFGVHEDAISNQFIPSDAQAANIAAGLLARTKNPRSPIWSLDLDNREHNLLLAILGVELERRISVPTNKQGTTGDFYVEQVSHTITPTRGETCSLVLSEAPAQQPFILDSRESGVLDQDEIGW